MSDTIDPKYQDVRLANRAMKRGQLQPKAYEKFLKTLPDSAEKSVPIEAEMEHIELEAEEKKGMAKGGDRE